MSDSATLMTDGANTTPAVAASPAPADAASQAPNGAAPAADPGATQQPTDGKTPDTPEVKTDDSKPPEKVVPEKYELKAPEGVTLDSEVLGEFEGIAKELKLSQEDAQKVADLGAKLSQKFATAQAQAIEDASSAWVAAVTADKEIGGEKLTENLASAQKALQAFGSPELSKLLNESRLGNHPEVIRLMAKVGKAISEDRMVTGGAGPSREGPKTAAEVLYPSK